MNIQTILKFAGTLLLAAAVYLVIFALQAWVQVGSLLASVSWNG